jgi:hypothetical protein
MTVSDSINKKYVDEIIENNNKNDDIVSSLENNKNEKENDDDDNNEKEKENDDNNEKENNDNDNENENKKENNDDDDDDDEILEGVLSSFFLGSLIGLFFGGIIGYYKDNFLLGLLLSITLTLVTSASIEYYIYNTLEQINYYRVLVGLPPIENFFKGISKGFKTIGKGIKSAGNAVVTAANAVASLGTAAIKAIIKAVLDPLFSGVKKSLTSILDNTLLKPVKLMEGLLKKVVQGIELATKSIVKMVEELANYMIKIPKVFIAFVRALFESIILPMMGVFKGFVVILMGVIELFLIIIKKIISIPRCLGVYMYYGGTFFFENVFLKIIPGWLSKIIKLTISFITFIFNIIYLFFYYMVYPLKLIGWDMIDNLNEYFKSDCMIINFKPAIGKMKDGVLMLIPKFKPVKIKI